MFFSSDPLGYFQARIESLIAYGDGASPTYDDGLGAEYAKKLRRSTDQVPRANDQARELQVAIDAMSLRQHAAESLIRLWAAVLEAREADPGSMSLWATLTNGRTRTVEVLQRIQDLDPASDLDTRLELLLPPRERPQFAANTKLHRAVEVLEAWLVHGSKLLVRGDIQLSAANNKVKHGLAVRAHNDIQIDYLETRAVPTDSDTIPLNAMQSATPLFDRPFVQYLTQPPKDHQGKHGLELTFLRLDTASLLVEATMLATVHAAVFHVAAVRHASTSSTLDEITPYPSLPIAPTPEQLLGNRVVGMRSPVTRPPGGGPLARPAGIGFSNDEFREMNVDLHGRRQMTVGE